jgi:hypothetical protein
MGKELHDTVRFEYELRPLNAKEIGPRRKRER